MRNPCLGSLAVLLIGGGLTLLTAAPPSWWILEPPLRATPAPPPKTPGELPTDLPPLPEEIPPCSSPALFPYPGLGCCFPPDGNAGFSLSPEESPVQALEGEPRLHVWVDGEPLLLWFRPVHASTLLGEESLGLLPGGRVAAGLTNSSSTCGIEASSFLIPQDTRTRTGEVQTVLSSQLWGAEMNGVGNLVKGSQGGIGVLGGFRYVNLKEDLTVSQASVGLNDDSSVLGDTGTGHEFLQTRNQFFGGQVGSLVELRWGKFCTYLIGKAALGTMHEVVESRGDASLSSTGER